MEILLIEPKKMINKPKNKEKSLKQVSMKNNTSGQNSHALHPVSKNANRTSRLLVKQ